MRSTRFLGQPLSRFVNGRTGSNGVVIIDEKFRRNLAKKSTERCIFTSRSGQKSHDRQTTKQDLRRFLEEVSPGLMRQ